MLDKCKISWRVGLKNLFVAVLVTVTLCSILLPLIPDTVSAQAAPLSPTEKAKRYQAASYLARCFQEIGGIKYRSLEEIKQAALYGANAPDANEAQLGLGYLVEQDNGRLICRDEPSQRKIMQLLEPLGDGEDFFISSGVYKPTGKGDYEAIGGRFELANKVFTYFNGVHGIDLNSNMSAGSQYFNLRAAFVEECAEPRQPQNRAGLPEVHIVDEQGNLTVDGWLYNPDKQKVPVGYGVEGAPAQEMNCRDIVQRMDALDDLAVEEQKKFIADGGVEGPNNPGSSQDDNPTCEHSGGITWIICPLINGLAELADGAFDNFIAPMLRTPPVDIANTNEPIFKVWVAMRNIANILLILAMIVVVFGQAIGGGLVDAYTAKKVLPRILAAAIMINLSIYMVALAVDVTNIIGQGLSRLLYAPFEAVGEFRFEISNTTAGLGITGLLIGGGAAIWAGGALVPYILLFVLLPLALAMLGVVFTLVLRMGLIQFLIVSAPIACVLYCLPNTEKYFKKWWDLFLKTLMVYPIIVLIFAIADILAVTTTMAGKASAGAEQLPAEIIAIVLMVLPLFMIPYAFKLAGGAISAVHGAILDRGKKGAEAIKGNPNDANSMQNKVRRRAGENMTMRQARLVDPGRETDAKLRHKLIGGVADKFGNVDARLAMYNLKSREEAEAMSSTGRDALRYAAGGYEEGGKYYNSKGKEISKNTYKRGKQLYGSTPTGIAQNLEYALRKAQTDEDFAAFRHAYARNAQQNGWNQKEMNDAWAAATYPHKSSMAASEWYSSPKLEDDGSITFKDISNDVVSSVAPNGETKKSSYSSYISDLHKTRLSYQLPARDQDYRAMLDRQTVLEDKLLAGQTLTDEESTQLAQTYEVFDSASHQYSAAGTGSGTGAGTPAGSSISATAGTAAAKPVIERAIAQRQARGFSLFDTGADTRNIMLGPATTAAGLPVRSSVVGTANVTGDVGRTNLPRNVTNP